MNSIKVFIRQEQHQGVHMLKTVSKQTMQFPKSSQVTFLLDFTPKTTRQTVNFGAYRQFQNSSVTKAKQHENNNFGDSSSSRENTALLIAIQFFKTKIKICR